MKKAILTTKVGMKQIFGEDGVLTPVTVLLAGPCVVTQVKTVENDGYAALQLGYGDVKVQRVNKPMKGHFDKADDFTPFDINEFYGSFSDETTEEGAASEDSTESATEAETTTSAE